MASSLFTLLRCFSLLARISAKTGSYRSIMRLERKSSAIQTPLGVSCPPSDIMRPLTILDDFLARSDHVLSFVPYARRAVVGVGGAFLLAFPGPAPGPGSRGK